MCCKDKFVGVRNEVPNGSAMDGRPRVLSEAGKTEFRTNLNRRRRAQRAKGRTPGVESPKKRAPMTPRLPEIELETIQFQARSLTSRALGAALTGHPTPVGLARYPTAKDGGSAAMQEQKSAWLRPRNACAAIPCGRCEALRNPRDSQSVTGRWFSLKCHTLHS